jgi:uncharacterized membrane protein
VTWSRRFRLRERVRGSLWAVPFAGSLIGLLAGFLLSRLDQSIDAPKLIQYSPATASTLLTAIVGASAALTGFVVTVTVLVVQMATGTFSARYMRLWYRDGMLKATLALLVGTLVMAFSLLRKIEQDFVPDFGVTVSGILVTSSLLLFLFFFDRFVHRLRPVAVAALVAGAGQQAFQEGERLAGREDLSFERYETEADPAALVRAPRAGSIQAFDPDGLARWAHDRDADVVLARAVGDFVPNGAVLMRVYGRPERVADAEVELQGMVALGEERTIEQDLAFSIRIMVDIAIRALSPAVNDPTTAVQVLDYLGETLRLVGSTELERPSDGRARVFMHGRRWEDFLELAVTEIREYGTRSIQVMRRLRAVLEELDATVLPQHRAAVEDELARLDASVELHWGDSVDRDRAGRADGQGIGGPGERDRYSEGLSRGLAGRQGGPSA